MVSKAPTASGLLRKLRLCTGPSPATGPQRRRHAAPAARRAVKIETRTVALSFDSARAATDSEAATSAFRMAGGASTGLPESSRIEEVCNDGP